MTPQAALQRVIEHRDIPRRNGFPDAAIMGARFRRS